MLKRLRPQDFRTMPLCLLNEHTEEVESLLEPMGRGESWGLISDAGLPILADPGSVLVERARARGIEVVAFAGPSSIVLSLMLSGLPAQQFAFHGYPPRESALLEKELRRWERETQVTHVFIEPPYRANRELQRCLAALQGSTRLCVASQLTAPEQYVRTDSIRGWRARGLVLQKDPTTFLLLAPFNREGQQIYA